MGNAAQAAPNQHIAAGADAGPGIDIAQHQHRTIHFQVLAGAHGAAVHMQVAIRVFEVLSVLNFLCFRLAAEP